MLPEALPFSSRRVRIARQTLLLSFLPAHLTGGPIDDALTLTVEARVLGQSRAKTAPWHVSLASRVAPGGTLSLRDLLVAIVTQEVEAYRERREQRRLTAVLAPEEIARAAERGKVDMGGHDLGQPVSAADAISAALQAFEDRLYYVFLDGQQLLSLGEDITVRQGSHLLFVRLVALIGG